MSSLNNSEVALGVFKRDPREIARGLKRHSAPVTRSNTLVFENSPSPAEKPIFKVQNIHSQTSAIESKGESSDFLRNTDLKVLKYEVKSDLILESKSGISN